MNYGTVTLAPGRTYRVTGATDDSVFDVVRVETDLLLGRLHVLSDYESLEFAPLRWLSPELTTELIGKAVQLVRDAQADLPIDPKAKKRQPPQGLENQGDCLKTQERRTSSCPSKT